VKKWLGRKRLTRGSLEHSTRGGWGKKPGPLLKGGKGRSPRRLARGGLLEVRRRKTGESEQKKKEKRVFLNRMYGGIFHEERYEDRKKRTAPAKVGVPDAEVKATRSA